MDIEIFSECFEYVEIHEAYQYIHDHRNNNSTDKNNDFDTDSEDDNSFITNSDDESDNSVDSTEHDDSSMDSASNKKSSKQKTGININKNWGSATIYQIKENDDITPVSVYFPENYEFRGKDLRKLNRVEYYCLTHIKPIFNGDGIINKCGRNKTKQFKFGKVQKLDATHAQ